MGNDNPDYYSKTRMKKLFEMYEKQELLDPHEKRILIATLEISDKRAGDIMQPLDQIFMLEIDTKLTRDILS